MCQENPIFFTFASGWDGVIQTRFTFLLETITRENIWNNSLPVTGHEGMKESDLWRGNRCKELYWDPHLLFWVARGSAGSQDQEVRATGVRQEGPRQLELAEQRAREQRQLRINAATLNLMEMQQSTWSGPKNLLSQSKTTIRYL